MARIRTPSFPLYSHLLAAWACEHRVWLHALCWELPLRKGWDAVNFIFHTKKCQRKLLLGC